LGKQLIVWIAGAIAINGAVMILSITNTISTNVKWAVISLILLVSCTLQSMSVLTFITTYGGVLVPNNPVKEPFHPSYCTYLVRGLQVYY